MSAARIVLVVSTFSLGCATAKKSSAPVPAREVVAVSAQAPLKTRCSTGLARPDIASVLADGDRGFAKADAYLETLATIHFPADLDFTPGPGIEAARLSLWTFLEALTTTARETQSAYRAVLESDAPLIRRQRACRRGLAAIELVIHEFEAAPIPLEFNAYEQAARVKGAYCSAMGGAAWSARRTRRAWQSRCAALQARR